MIIQRFINHFRVYYDGHWHIRHGTWLEMRWVQFWWLGSGRFALEIRHHGKVYLAVSDWQFYIRSLGRYFTVMQLKPTYKWPVVRLGRTGK